MNVPEREHKMAHTTPPNNKGAKPVVGAADSGGGEVRSYASPSRGILDAIGAPRAIQRVMASPAPTLPGPTRVHAAAGDDRLIRSVADIGNRVRDARSAMGMTQQRFADLAGVGRRFLIELEHGKPGLEIGRVLAVCKAAGIRLGFLS